jgi:hypothetical protein
MASKNYTFLSSKNTVLYENNENSLTAEKIFKGSGVYITPTKNVPGRSDDVTGCVLTAMDSKGRCVWSKPNSSTTLGGDETDIDISLDDLLDVETINDNDTIVYNKKTQSWTTKNLDSIKQKRDPDNLGIIVKSVRGIQIGGSPVLPGGLLNINVDETVLLTKGDQTKNGILQITDKTNSTNYTNGCLILDGGIGITKDVNCNGNISTKTLNTSGLFYKTTVTSIDDDENIVYTSEDFLGGIINRDCSGSNRTDTVDYAENIINLIPNVEVGTTFDCYIRNVSTENNTITFEGGDDVILDPGNIEIEQNETVHLLIRVENITEDEEFVTIYVV